MPVCPAAGEPLQEDWDLLLSFLPENWEALARRTGALRKLRKDKSPSKLLRTLLLHLGCGHSLRETVVRARQAQLADLSDVALLKRLRKCAAPLISGSRQYRARRLQGRLIGRNSG